MRKTAAVLILLSLLTFQGGLITGCLKRNTEPQSAATPYPAAPVSAAERVYKETSTAEPPPNRNDSPQANNIFETEPIPFEISRIPLNALNLAPEPVFKVITSSDTINTVDFDQFLVVVVSLGLKRSGGYGVKIEKISWFRDDVRVEYSVVTPPAGSEPIGTGTIVYQTAILDRAILKNKTEVRFNLTPVKSVQQSGEYRWPSSEWAQIPENLRRTVPVYFPAAKNPLRLVPEPRIINTTGDVFRQAIAHLVDGPRSPLSLQGFSRNTWIRSVRVIGDQILIDLSVPGFKNFSPEFQSTMLASIVITLTEFPRIGTVKISLDGKFLGDFKRRPELILKAEGR